MTGDELSDLRRKVQSSTLLTEKEKQEWIYLLPKMKAEQTEELNEILALKVPSVAPPPPPQVETADLTRPVSKPAPVTPGGIDSLRLEDLRAAPSPYVFFENLSAKIKTPEDAAAFARSPLYQSYLASGVGFLNNQSPGGLTKEEFAAIAEFRGSLGNF